MTAEEIEVLNAMFDRKLSPITAKVDEHDKAITGFKAILGFLVWLGGGILALVAVMQGFFKH